MRSLVASLWVYIQLAQERFFLSLVLQVFGLLASLDALKLFAVAVKRVLAAAVNAKDQETNTVVFALNQS